MSSKISDPLQYLIDNVSDTAIINTSLLAGGHFPSEGNQSARTVYFKGKAAVVFAFRLQKQLKALKVWPAKEKDQRKKHYEAIAPIIHNSGLSFFAPFIYIDAALNIDGEVYDALLMDWVGRQNLKEYACANINNHASLDALAEQLLQLHKVLNNAGIALGRFHPGNIYINGNNELQLIGYDAISCAGKQAFENEGPPAYPDYAHPSGRMQAAKADYFAALILYLGIKALSHDNVLWGRCKIGFTEGFIFSATDCANLENATIYQWLRKKKWPEIDKLLDILKTYCEVADPAKLLPFYELLEETRQLVPIKEEKQLPVPVISKMEELVEPVSTEATMHKEDVIVEKLSSIIGVEDKVKPAADETTIHPLVIVSFPEKKTSLQSSHIENNDEPDLPVTNERVIALNNKERKDSTGSPAINSWKKRKWLIAVLALLTIAASAIVTYLISKDSLSHNAQDYLAKEKQKNDHDVDASPKKDSTIPSSVAVAKDRRRLTDSAQLNNPVVKASTINITGAADSIRASAIAVNNTSSKIPQNTHENVPGTDKTQEVTAFNKTGIDSSLPRNAANKNSVVINENNSGRQGNIAIRKNKNQNEGSFSIGAPPKK